MRRFAGNLGRERGVTVTEFAIIAPVLFFLILSIIEGGRIFSTWVIITHEAEQGARYGVVQYGDPSREPTLVQSVQTYVTSRIGSTMISDSSHLAVSVQLNQSDPSVTVAVNYNVDVVTPLIQNFVPNPFPVRAVAVMRAE